MLKEQFDKEMFSVFQGKVAHLLCKFQWKTETLPIICCATLSQKGNSGALPGYKEQSAAHMALTGSLQTSLFVFS